MVNRSLKQKVLLSVGVSLCIIISSSCGHVVTTKKDTLEKAQHIRLTIERSNKVGTQYGYVGQTLCTAGYDKDIVSEVSSEYGEQVQREIMQGYLMNCK